MAPAPRLYVFLALAGLACLGIVSGAASQREKAIDIHDPAIRDDEAAGNLVALTAFLVALPAAGAAVLLGRLRWREAWFPALALAATVYTLVMVVQSAFPTWMGIEEQRFLLLSVNPLFAHLQGIASVLLPIFALAAVGLWVAGWALRRLAGIDGAPDPDGLLRRHIAVSAVAGPLLLIAVGGSVQAAIAMAAEGRSGHAWLLGPFAAVLACLVAVAFLRTYQFTAFIRNRRLAAVVETQWLRYGRLEAVLLAAAALVALAYAVLPTAKPTALELGQTLGLSTRMHTLLAALAVGVAMLPVRQVHRDGARLLRDPPGGPSGIEGHGAHPVVVAHLAAILAAAAALVALAFLAIHQAGPDMADLGSSTPLALALWPWLAALLPFTVLAVAHGDTLRATVPILLLAATLWGIGNTVVAVFDGFSDDILAHRTAPEILALWRTAGAAVAAFGVLRLLRLSSRARLRGPLQWTVAVGGAVGAAGLALLELPLTAWFITGTTGGESVGMGSVVAVQDASVQAVMHLLALGAGLGFAAALARLHRPDWFGRRPQAVTEAVSAPAPS